MGEYVYSIELSINKKGSKKTTHSAKKIIDILIIYGSIFAFSLLFLIFLRIAEIIMISGIIVIKFKAISKRGLESNNKNPVETNRIVNIKSNKKRMNELLKLS
jgi:hypothetical protein